MLRPTKPKRAVLVESLGWLSSLGLGLARIPSVWRSNPSMTFDAVADLLGVYRSES